MRRREALATMIAPLVLPVLLPAPTPVFIGDFDLADLKWDTLDDHIVGIKRQSELTFTLNFVPNEVTL